MNNIFDNIKLISETAIDFGCLALIVSVSNIEYLNTTIKLATTVSVLVLTVFRAYYWYRKQKDFGKNKN